MNPTAELLNMYFYTLLLSFMICTAQLEKRTVDERDSSTSSSDHDSDSDSNSELELVQEEEGMKQWDCESILR